MKKINIIQKFSFKKIFLLFILIVCLDLINILKFSYGTRTVLEPNVWFPFSIGLILFSTAFVNIEKKIEKIATVLLGMAFVLEALSKLLSYSIILYFSIALEMLSLYCFYIELKHVEKYRESLIPRK